MYHHKQKSNRRRWSMSNEDEISRSYKMATTQNEVIQYCLKDEDGYVMTKQGGMNVWVHSLLEKMMIAYTIILIGVIWTFPEMLEYTSQVIVIGILFCFTWILIIGFRLKFYAKYYLTEKALIIKKTFSEKVVTYDSLLEKIIQWKPLVYKGSLYLMGQELVRTRYITLSRGGIFCMILLKILGEDQITVEDFAKMQQPGHWKEKREAKKELKKRKQYVKNKK